MKTFRTIILVVGLASGVALPMRSAQKSSSDLLSPQKRVQSVDTAVRLARPPQPIGPVADLPQPFNPPGFDQPDPDEKAIAAAAAAAARPSSSGAPAPSPISDRALLDAVAARILPSGTMTGKAGEPLLIFGGTKKVQKGNIITVDYNGQSYDLELVSIDRTTFTLRYRAEEITRPIKPTK